MEAESVEKRVQLSHRSIELLRDLAQTYNLREEYIIERALDILFNLTDLLQAPGYRQEMTTAETIQAQNERDEAEQDFDRVLAAYQSSGDEKLADALLKMLSGSLGEAKPGEYDPDLKWGGYYEGR